MTFLNRLKLLLGLLTVLSVPSFAQDDLEELLRDNVKDGEKLIGAYVAPVMKSLSLGLNQGWYNTAKAHKIAGVDLTITVNAIAIPSSDNLFDPAKLGLTDIELDPSSPAALKNKAPTMAGPDIEPVFRLKDNHSVTFQGPPGLDLKGSIGSNKVPVPMVHLGFGLPKGTDLKLRFVPTVDLGDDGSLKLFGIGVMHDIKQWIPGIKLMPFDLSAFVGYTKLEANYKLDADNPQHADQKGIFSVSATTIQGVISKKFSVATVYAGLGYNIAKSNIALKGSYDLDENGTNDVKDPVDLDFAASGPRVTAGARLKLAVFTFHADYTLQKYNSLTVGFGISVR